MDINSMLIQGALANCDQTVSNDEFIKYLISQLPNTSFFKLQPPPGSIMAAAIDWRGIMHDAAAIATLGTLLWNAYTQFIKPIEEQNPNSSPSIFIQIKNNNDQSFQMMINKNYPNKEIFIHEFNEKMQRIITTQSDTQNIAEVEEIIHSGYWVQIK